MRSQKYREGVAYELSQVPPEFMPLRPLEAETPGLRRYIASLCQRGEVRRYRCRRKMFVHKDDMNAAISRWNDRKHVALAADCGDEHKECRHVFQSVDAESMTAANDAAMSLMEMRLTFSRVEAILGRVAVILERVATAAEAIATQPKKDEFAEFTNN